MRKLVNLVLLLVLLGCSEPYNFDSTDSSIDVVDGKITTIAGRSYVDIYKIENGKKIPNTDLDVNIISGSGEVYEFAYKEEYHSYRSTDMNFAGQIGTKYRMEASSSNGALYYSEYDSIPEIIDFDVQLKDSAALVFVANTTTIVEKRATSIYAEIPLSNMDFYTRLKFRYIAEDFFVPGDSLYASDPTLYTLYKSNDEENHGNRVKVRLGERLIDKYFIFVDPSCTSTPRGFLTGNVLPRLPNPCIRYLEFWKMTYEVSLESMSASSYLYWENAQKLTKNDGLLFDTYPFPLTGNITCNDCVNEVLGNFRAVSESIRKEDWSK